ncbi:MAG TPA: barstar family protein [Pirellulales bacterium]|nr:barstar family protein [Pirellulales bacterium]
MESVLSELSFDSRPLQLNVGDDLIAHVGSGIRTRAKLFSILRHELRLPDYFGENWDALFDCLRDLSWIKQRRVVILHSELPQLGADDLWVYLDLLSECIKDWKPADDHPLIVVFPEAARQVVSAMVQQQ